MKTIPFAIVLLVMVFATPAAVAAKPARACLKAETGEITIRKRCKKKKGFIKLTAEVLQDLGASQVGPQGPQGPQGLQGPQGSPGLLGVQVRTVNSFSSSAGVHSLSAMCEEGEIALSGGCRMTGSVANNMTAANNPRTASNSSAPAGAVPTGWLCVWYSQEVTGTGYNAFVTCGTLP